MRLRRGGCTNAGRRVPNRLVRPLVHILVHDMCQVFWTGGRTAGQGIPTRIPNLGSLIARYCLEAVIQGKTLFLESMPRQALEQTSSKVAEDVVHTLQACFQGRPHFVSGTPNCRCTITCNILDNPFPSSEHCVHFFTQGLTKVVD